MRLLSILALVAALVAAVIFWAPLRLSALVMIGRSPICPFSNAVKSADNLRRQIELKDSILAASRVVEKDSQGYHLWETPKGRYWVPEGSDYVLPFNLAEQERKIYGEGERAVKAGDVVLDCGANVGVYTRLALDAGARIVVAIEPAPENIECLRRNFVSEIKAGRVIVYPKGVWDKDDFLTFYVDPSNSAADSFLIERDGARKIERVPLTTIDKLTEELKLDRVDFIKMDIEGAEPKALAGARAVLAKFKPRIAISAYHAPDHPTSISTAIRAARPDYKMECGPCAEANLGVRPDILHFY